MGFLLIQNEPFRLIRLHKSNAYQELNGMACLCLWKYEPHLPIPRIFFGCRMVHVLSWTFEFSQIHMLNSISQCDGIWSNEEIMHVKKMSEEMVLNLLILRSFEREVVTLKSLSTMGGLWKQGFSARQNLGFGLISHEIFNMSFCYSRHPRLAV